MLPAVSLFMGGDRAGPFERHTGAGRESAATIQNTRKSQPGRKSSCKVKACVKPLSLEIYRSELGCVSLFYLGPFCTGVWTTRPPGTSTQYPSDPGSLYPVAKTANNWWNTFFVIEDRFQPPHLKYSADRSSFQLCGSFQTARFLNTK